MRIARIFNTYGPRLDTKNPAGYGRALIKFVLLALNNKPISMYGGGMQTRSFCYITDQVIGLMKLLIMEKLDGEVFNIGSEEEITISQLINTVIELTNSSSKLINTKPAYDIRDDPLRRKPDIAKAQKNLGWHPKVGLKEGLSRTIEWVKEN